MAMRRHDLLVLLLIGLMGCASDNRPLQLTGGAGPIYPAQARAQGIEGYVEVQYDVTTAGTVTNAVVMQADPVGVFEEAALMAVRSWRFNPLRVNGVAQPALGRRSTVTFALGDTSRYDQYDREVVDQEVVDQKAD